MVGKLLSIPFLSPFLYTNSCNTKGLDNLQLFVKGQGTIYPSLASATTATHPRLCLIPFNIIQQNITHSIPPAYSLNGIQTRQQANYPKLTV